MPRLTSGILSQRDGAVERAACIDDRIVQVRSPSSIVETHPIPVSGSGVHERRPDADSPVAGKKDGTYDGTHAVVSSVAAEFREQKLASLPVEPPERKALVKPRGQAVVPEGHLFGRKLWCHLEKGDRSLDQSIVIEVKIKA